MSEDRDLLGKFEARQLAIHFDQEPPEAVIAWALERWHSRIALCTSFQAEGMAILDMAWRINPGVRVFTVDTGRLPQETYDIIERVRDRYGIEVDVYFPDARQVEAMVRDRGPNLFYKSVEGRLLCCHVRKVEPIQRALEGLDAWITGLRRDQWVSRANISKIEIDQEHGGLAKINPLGDWTSEKVWDYIRAYDVPYHSLYDQGYTSIGCAPCTRPTQEGEDPRAGRWWWENDVSKECGIHGMVEIGAVEQEQHEREQTRL
ncbi:MAG: phosphoadenylyl-sulfate reductase [Candidatus Tectomicrobia bacterium]|nr:phosphoadenylyl-sulfate reductase [Candidatus Tectomicrobia bacterium]